MHYKFIFTNFLCIGDCKIILFKVLTFSEHNFYFVYKDSIYFNMFIIVKT